MDINRHKFHGNYKLSGYEPGKITVNNTIYTTSIVVSKDHLQLDWKPQKIKEFTSKDLQTLIDLNPEIIVIGTGVKHHFVDESLLTVAYEKDIPVELMSSNKACMLYTILVQEQKNVIAAIMP